MSNPTEGSGRMWIIPEPATIEAFDAPIFARLYDRYFPLRWVIGHPSVPVSEGRNH